MPISRKFVLNCQDQETCIELINTLLENLPSTTFISYRIRGNKVEITVQGLKHEVQGIWALIRHYYSDIMKIKSQTTKQVKEYPIRYIVSKTHRTFPPDVLVEVLRTLGYIAEVQDDNVVTNADLDIIVSIASRIADIIDRIRYEVVGKSTKKIVAYAAIVLNREPKEVIEELKNAGILVVDEETGKPKTRINIVQAIRGIKTIYKQELRA